MVSLSAPAVVATTDIQSSGFGDRLTVKGVLAWRSQNPVMGGGVATFVSSDMFKSLRAAKPKARRWDRTFALVDPFYLTSLSAGRANVGMPYRLNTESKARKPSTLKEAARYLATPGLISLGGGLPSSQYFPLERVDIKVPNPPHFSEIETREDGILKSAGKHDIAEGRSLYDLHVALNYGQGTGSGQILRFATEHTEIVHHPPYGDWHCCMTVGNTSALDMAYRMFTTRGEYILVEEYAFPAAMETATPLGIKCVGINMDAEGLMPSHMDSILGDWDPSAHEGAPKPWLLYTVPTGQNPTGATQGAHRRRELYRVAQKHDIFILEDDPYYFLQMQPYTECSIPPPPPSSHEEFLAGLVPSLLSLDVDGRVLRMDSFSKVIAPGIRTGWISASEQIIERYIRHSELSTQNPSGLAQIVLYKLLEEAWGHEGYFDWLIYIRMEYTRRRDNICRACEKYLPKGVAAWTEPAAGMFHWIKINWTLHPQAKEKGFATIEDEIFHANITQGVLLIKSSFFRAPAVNITIPLAAEHDLIVQGQCQKDQQPEMFFRATFAMADDEEVMEAIRRFGGALRGVFEL